jgi:hypothetical protein
MRVEAMQQCDAGPRALFPGQRYDLPDELAAELLVAGKVREVGEAKEKPAPEPETRIVGKATRGRKR